MVSGRATFNINTTVTVTALVPLTTTAMATKYTIRVANLSLPLGIGKAQRSVHAALDGAQYEFLLDQMKKLLLSGIAALLLATGTAHAAEVMLKLQKEDGEIFMTIMDIQESCPEGTKALFDEANKKNQPVIIRIENKRYEVLEVLCIGKQK